MNLIKKLNDYLFYLKYEKNPKKLDTSIDIEEFFGIKKYNFKSLKPIIGFINKNFNYIEKIKPEEIIKIDSGFNGFVFITKNKDLVIKIEIPMGSSEISHLRMFEKIKKYNFPFVKEIKHLEYLKSHNLILTITKKYYHLSEHQYAQQLQMLISSIDQIMLEYYEITLFNNNKIKSKSRLDKYISKNAPLFLNKREIDLFIKQLKIESNPSYYTPCSNLKIVHRIINNLILAYEKLGYAEKIEELKILAQSLKLS